MTSGHLGNYTSLTDVTQGHRHALKPSVVQRRVRVHPARNGDVVRGAFIIDAHDREIISWHAVVNAGISGSDIRDIMLQAVETRFGTCRAPSVIEMLTDNGSPYIAGKTRIFARQLGLKPCFTPVQSP